MTYRIVFREGAFDKMKKLFSKKQKAKKTEVKGEEEDKA